MSRYVAVALLGVAFVLPLGIAGIAAAVSSSVEDGVPLWVSILLVLLMIAALAFFAAMGAYGSDHFDDASGDFDAYWIFGVIVDFIAVFWLAAALSDD
jgi:hypothetical protein